MTVAERAALIAGWDDKTLRAMTQASWDNYWKIADYPNHPDRAARWQATNQYCDALLARTGESPEDRPVRV